MSMSELETELVAVAGSVASGCKPCTNYHVKAARAAGADDRQLREAVAIAINTRLTSTQVMDSHALARIGAEDAADAPIPQRESERLSMMIAIGAAFAVNCATSLKQYLAAAGSAGISADDIARIVELMAFIKTKAASHVERLTGSSEAGGESTPG